MSNKYVSPSNLTRYDSKIKEYIDDKTSNLESYDDTEIRGLISDLEENKVSKEDGKGLFSGSYNDLTDAPTIPSIEGLVSEETLNNTLADYAKTEDLPSEYDDSGVVKLQGSNTTKADGVDGVRGFSLNIKSSDGINSGISLLDVTNSSNATSIYPAEVNTPTIHTDKIAEKSSGKGVTVSSILNANHINASSAEISWFDADVTFDGIVTSNDGFVGDIDGLASKNLPLSGGAMNKNANITIPSANLVGGITLNDDSGYIATLTPDCLHIQDNEGNTSVIGGSSVYSSEFVGDLTGTASKANALSNTTAIGSATQPVYINASGVPTKCTYTLGKSVPSNAVFTDTKYTLPTASSSTLGGVKTTSTVTSTSGYTACPIIGGVPYYKPSTVTTTEGADPTIYQTQKIQCGSGAYIGNSGIAMGAGTYVTGDYAMALGYETETIAACALSIGIYNDDTSSGSNVSTFSWLVDGQGAKNAFMIGRGSSETTRANAFRVTYSGATYALSAFNSSGADYAEFISEWADGNVNNEDRVGYFVTLKDNKLYKANDGDYILGVTSGNPSVVGNGDETYFWKYERDEFNRFIYVDSPILDENGNEFIDNDGNIAVGKTMKLSDKYDPTQTYIARKDRPEWDYVGMTGVIPVRDDGTCIANGYCKCGVDGVATVALEKGDFTYFVKERISDNVIAVIVR